MHSPRTVKSTDSPSRSPRFAKLDCPPCMSAANHNRGATPVHPSNQDARAHLKHSEPLHNCDPKYLLTTVLPKLYRKTVGG